MDAIEMIQERRSVRKFKNEKVDREVIEGNYFHHSLGTFLGKLSDSSIYLD